MLTCQLVNEIVLGISYSSSVSVQGDRTGLGTAFQTG